MERTEVIEHHATLLYFDAQNIIILSSNFENENLAGHYIYAQKLVSAFAWCSEHEH